jgi:hypothetical protein
MFGLLQLDVETVRLPRAPIETFATIIYSIELFPRQDNR